MHEQSHPRPPISEDIHRLDAGRWQVRTCGAVYVIDVDAGTAIRLPAIEGTYDFEVAKLRRDGETLRLLASLTVTVGQPMVLHLSVREDVRATTFRFTTPVVAVQRLPELEQGLAVQT